VEYHTKNGRGDTVPYHPDDFEWPECPVSALTRPAAPPAMDPVELASLLSETHAVGGRGAVFSLARRDPRLFDAAAVIERCRVAEHNARVKAEYSK